MAADGVLNLNFGQQKTLVAGDRLGSVEDQVPAWLAAAYTDVWNAAKWTFKRVSREAFYTTADGTSGGTPTATPVMPAAFASIRALVDDQGDALTQLAEFDFESRYTADTTTGRPCYFMVVDRQITLWPTPDAAYLFSLSYNRRIATRTASGDDQEGIYQVDGDLPLWDDHHYILVTRAKIIALKNLTDPTAQMLQDEYGRLLDAMMDEYIEALPRGYQVPAWRP